MGAISVFLNSKGWDQILNAVARALWFFGANNNVEFLFTHKRGAQMEVPDLMSQAYLSSDMYNKASAMIAPKQLELVKISPTMHDFNDYV